MKRIFPYLASVLLLGIAALNWLYWHAINQYKSQPCLANTLNLVADSPHAPAVLLAAQAEAQRLLRGEPAQQARLLGVSADGGSANYVTPDYDLTIWQRQVSLNGQSGYKRGYTVTLHAPGLPVSFEHSWFTPRPH